MNTQTITNEPFEQWQLSEDERVHWLKVCELVLQGVLLDEADNIEVSLAEIEQVLAIHLRSEELNRRGQVIIDEVYKVFENQANDSNPGISLDTWLNEHKPIPAVVERQVVPPDAIVSSGTLTSDQYELLATTLRITASSLNLNEGDAKQFLLENFSSDRKKTQRLLEISFYAGLIFAGTAFAFAVGYLIFFSALTSRLVSQSPQILNPGLSQINLASTLFLVRMTFLSCGIISGIAISTVGFSLFLIGAKGEMDVEAKSETISVKLARFSPGVLVLIAGVALIVICSTRSFSVSSLMPVSTVPKTSEGKETKTLLSYLDIEGYSSEASLFEQLDTDSFEEMQNTVSAPFRRRYLKSKLDSIDLALLKIRTELESAIDDKRRSELAWQQKWGNKARELLLAYLSTQPPTQEWVKALRSNAVKGQRIELDEFQELWFRTSRDASREKTK